MTLSSSSDGGTATTTSSALPSTKKIPKGTVVRIWEPYLLVPFWIPQEDEYDDTILSKILPRYSVCPIVSRLFSSTPTTTTTTTTLTLTTSSTTTSSYYLHNTSLLHHLLTTTTKRSIELQGFIRTLYRDQSFEALVMLTILQLVIGEGESLDDDDDINKNNQHPSSIDQWETWLKEEEEEEEKEDDKDNDGQSISSNTGNTADQELCLLLMEGWPMIQEYISWRACMKLYQFFMTNLHEIILPHPLSIYIKETLFHLSPDEWEIAVESLQQQQGGYKRRIPIPSTTTTDTTTTSPTTSSTTTSNRLKMSHYLSEYFSSSSSSHAIPVRRIGVLLYSPRKRRNLSNTNPNDKEVPFIQRRSSPWQPRQSSIPSATLELVLSPTTSTTTNISDDATIGRIQCQVVTLYDHYEDGANQEPRMTIMTRPPQNVQCFHSIYRRDKSAYCDSLRQQITSFSSFSSSSSSTSSSPSSQSEKARLVLRERIDDTQRLAHTLFQNQVYDEAQTLYNLCYDYYTLSILAGGTTAASTPPLMAGPTSAMDCFPPNPVSDSERRPQLEETMVTAAELWHAMAAINLAKHEFLQAQRHWSHGNEQNPWMGKIHSGIALQLEKQGAYGYLTPLLSSYPSCGDIDHDDADKGTTTSNTSKTTPINTFTYEILSPRRLFIAPSLIPNEMCDRLIQWAEEHGNGRNSCTSNGNGDEDGWTTMRHYAVPTNDIPVHKIPKVLEWFQHWMTTECQSLLQEQFQISNGHHGRSRRRRRFYVHDAFVVRYTASSTSRFLPLHYDESTHSMILALNDDFEGGGTYFFDVDTTLRPSKGSLVTFRGDAMLHGGNVVTKGVRYILAVFLFLDEECNPTHDHDNHKEGEGIYRDDGISPCSKQILPSNKRLKIGLDGDEGPNGGGFSFDFF